MIRPLLAIGLWAASASAAATTWNCTNPDFEISCNDTSCAALPPGDYTPMSISFNDEGFVYACMYSGCWEGDGEILRSDRFLSIHARQLAWSTDPNPGEMRGDLALLVDLEDNVALMKVGGYSQPLLCEVRDG